jgi:hypothetical protein
MGVGKIYSVFLEDKLIGTTMLECADPPMGVVWGQLLNAKEYNVEFWIGYCSKNDIYFRTIPEIGAIQTFDIPRLKIVSPEGREVRGQSNNINGTDEEGLMVEALAVAYPFFEEEFPHHVQGYDDFFKKS